MLRRASGCVTHTAPSRHMMAPDWNHEDTWLKPRRHMMAPDWNHEDTWLKPRRHLMTPDWSWVDTLWPLTETENWVDTWWCLTVMKEWSGALFKNYRSTLYNRSPLSSPSPPPPPPQKKKFKAAHLPQLLSVVIFETTITPNIQTACSSDLPCALPPPTPKNTQQPFPNYM